MKSEFSEKLRAWYEANKRDLRWRHTRDPYLIWLSETILQQTRVQQGAAYYDRFVEAYPTIRDLAAAPEDDVLKLWQGLGYYSRARNLHAAARWVVEHHGGAFPRTYDEVRRLKGVGDYTAAAVCSFAYGLPTAVVDGNVYRLYSRLLDIDLAIDTPAGRRAFRTLAEEWLDKEHPADYNQALMEFGALHCTPRSPRCAECPFEQWCLAHAAGTVAERPRKQGRTKIRDRYLNYLHLTAAGQTLLHRRTAGDIWQGLYEFPLIETAEAVPFEVLPLAKLGIDRFHLVRSIEMPPHQLSHQRLHARFHRLEVEALPPIPETIAIPEEELDRYAIPRLVDRYLDKLSAK